MNQFCPFCCSVDEPVLPFCCSVDEHVLPFCCSVDQYEPVLLLSGSEDEPVLLLSGSVDGPVLLSVGLSWWWSSDEKLVLNDLLYCTCTAYNCTWIQSTYTVCRGQYTVCVYVSWSSMCIRNSTYSTGKLFNDREQIFYICHIAGRPHIQFACGPGLTGKNFVLF